MSAAGGFMGRRGVQSVTLTPSRYYYGSDERVYCDFASQPGYPSPLFAVPVYTASGSPTRFTQDGRVEQTDPSSPEESPQVLVMFVGVDESPIAIAERTSKRGASTLPLTSHGWVNGASSLSLTDAGNLIAALHASATFTVSRGGEADGRLTLVAELVSYLQDLTTQLEVMLARLAVVEAAIPIPPPIPTVTFPDPTDYTLGAAILPVASDAE